MKILEGIYLGVKFLKLICWGFENLVVKLFFLPPQSVVFLTTTPLREGGGGSLDFMVS